MYQIECESCPHEWMLGSAATQIQKSRAKLAEYIKANKEDIVLIENCTAATASVIRAVGLRAGDTAIHLSTAYGMVKNCLSYCAAAPAQTWWKSKWSFLAEWHQSVAMGTLWI